MRNLLDGAPKSLQAEVCQRGRAILDAPDLETARLLLNQVLQDLVDKAPNRRRLRTTNGVERLNEEIRRWERVIRIFPNRESALRLLGVLLMEMDEKWTTGHRYLDMREYWVWREAQTPAMERLAWLFLPERGFHTRMWT